jgi:hypothetical protein
MLMTLQEKIKEKMAASSSIVSECPVICAVHQIASL